MIKAFTDFINSKVQISKDIELAIAAVCNIETFPKNHFLLKEGTVPHYLYFIIEGSARTFYYHDGKEVTSWIYKENQLLTAWGSFYNRVPAYESIELLENSTVCILLNNDLQKLYDRFPKMQIFGRLLVEEQLGFLDNFYKGYMFMSAKERYDLLISFFPDVTQRVNLGYIASLLGITQETLSRIRRKN